MSKRLRVFNVILNTEERRFADWLAKHDEDIRAEERKKVLDRFVNCLEKNQEENWEENLEYGITFADIDHVIEQMEGEEDGIQRDDKEDR